MAFGILDKVSSLYKGRVVLQGDQLQHLWCVCDPLKDRVWRGWARSREQGLKSSLGLAAWDRCIHLQSKVHFSDLPRVLICWVSAN